ncbi:MAG: hypothetical protein KGN31_03500 [Betaproteobacteria bacterium]|nr:hypothetical protein [Betaproteobacteria bacterium]
MKNNFVLFCKSYRNDVLKCKKLLESVVTYNKDKIPFFLSIPQKDFSVFEKYINFSAINKETPLTLLTDEEIAIASDPNGLNYYQSFSGYLHQQVIKSEAWKLIGCENYLCLDSDSYFTNEFHIKNFFHPDGVPYSLLHESTELLTIARKLNKTTVIDNFIKDSNLMKIEFGREGPDYDFGPPPMIWNKKVWTSLYENHLVPRNENIWTAIERIPAEIRWYGETLLKYNAIPIHAIEPLFNFYHYEWQYNFLKIHKSNKLYLGEVIQSNWDETLIPTFAKKNMISRNWKKLKRIFN